MELNLTTYILEAVNFFILIWILKRLFYQPVKKIIDERKNTIEKSLQESSRIKEEAKDLQEKYENRLRDWEREKEEKRAEFLEAVSLEKKEIFSKFDKQLADAREKASSMEKQYTEEIFNRAEKEAMNICLSFVSILLKKLVNPELEKRIIDMAIDQLSTPVSKKNLHAFKAADQPKINIVIKSAFEIDESQKERLLTVLKEVTNEEFDREFIIEPELLSGIRVSIGSYLIEANLKDELKYFSEKSRK